MPKDDDLCQAVFQSKSVGALLHYFDHNSTSASKNISFRSPRNFKESTERINTPDGDFLDLDFVNFDDQNDALKSKTTKKNATVVILHGLESNTKGPLVTKMANGFLSKGFSCCLISFRGCSEEPNRTPGGYHLGFTRDVDLVCRTLQER